MQHESTRYGIKNADRRASMGDSIFFGILQKRTMHPCMHCIALGKRHLIGKMEEKAFYIINILKIH